MKKRSAIVCDLDGTLLRWQLFHRVIEGMVAKGLMAPTVLTAADATLQKYVNREGAFDDWVVAQVNAYQGDGGMRGISVDAVLDVAREVVREQGKREHVFGRELAAAGKEAGLPIAILSGTMQEAVEIYADARGYDIALGTEHPKRRGIFTGEKPKEWVLDKQEAIRHLATQYDLDLPTSVAMGDSTSDIGMFDNVGWPICFNPSEKLLRVARQRTWVCVFERKDVIVIFRPDVDGMLVECTLESCLPPTLAAALKKRLHDRLQPSVLS